MLNDDRMIKDINLPYLLMNTTLILHGVNFPLWSSNKAFVKAVPIMLHHQDRGLEQGVVIEVRVWGHGPWTF